MTQRPSEQEVQCISVGERARYRSERDGDNAAACSQDQGRHYSAAAAGTICVKSADCFAEGWAWLNVNSRVMLQEAPRKLPFLERNDVVSEKISVLLRRRLYPLCAISGHTITHLYSWTLSGHLRWGLWNQFWVVALWGRGGDEYNLKLMKRFPSADFYVSP